MDDDYGMGHPKNRVDDQVYLPVRNVTPELGHKCCVFLFFFLFFFCLFCFCCCFFAPVFFLFLLLLPNTGVTRAFLAKYSNLTEYV